MSKRLRQPSPRRRSTRRLFGLGSECLEVRRLLAATPLNVAAGLTLAIASPLPGLASTAGPISPSQVVATNSATVAPVATTSVAPVSVVSMATGPATTLSPLANDSETANAAASEVARPRPGQTDRVQAAIEDEEVAPPPRVEISEPVVVVPGPEQQVPEPVIEADPLPAVPVEAPAPVPVPEIAPLPEVPVVSLAAWDVALDVVTPDALDLEGVTTDEAPASAPSVAVAASVVVAAWGGWQHVGRRATGRSRQNPLVVVDRIAGPGKLPPV